MYTRRQTATNPRTINIYRHAPRLTNRQGSWCRRLFAWTNFFSGVEDMSRPQEKQNVQSVLRRT